MLNEKVDNLSNYRMNFKKSGKFAKILLTAPNS